MNKLLVFVLSKSLITFGIVLAIAYSAACVLLFVAQGKFIFFPARAIETTPDDFKLKYQDVWLQIPAKTAALEMESVHGWWIPASENPRKFRGEVREVVPLQPSQTPPSPPLLRGGVREAVPVPPLNKGGLGGVPVPPLHKGNLGRVVLYLHGNGSNVGANVEHANRFHGLGLSVFLIDYRGYGKSQGDFPSESRVYEDVEQAWDYLVKQRGINPNQIYIYGHSLGGAIAIDLAVRHPEAAGLIVEGSFTSVRAMVDFQKPLFRAFPIDLLLAQRFDSLSKVDRLQMPVLFIHGTADTVVPAEMSKKMFDAAPEPKQLYMVPNGGHNNAAQIGGAEYLRVVSKFLL
ncbi:MAG: alpha/beta fold hydrolase [Microcoleus sp. PH2017_29_MFU_D_A]|uniref:alpha/beta hydrolase n=1 Tax=unclassified Microcoleus TaxID=2642155 RepID=UPI001D76E024|nr:MULTISPECIES: alpha/beta fold hydrolase [unclassified Microcoleus]MCC3420586.1 alpha/beta fold hydrolase [Microcoleus sp. PH2017_07_MST_O_A]MCC3468856.1 alpha/beta fold hydrolase [Microcoleus sp. PH2017_06_SFM_O_A]MCC3508701.1 alpha/beta fold hydrolase [Microcoleus sp. PH2017_17_BER_D_A]MCC3424719.1 alpha/beta fold hydrolase [Microcoleus sp. PH2017_01_SCD_O_A]MCC3452920.1 alpha/beta fold hydrolase [Microcoleus sp. PH2017_08_TRC_O_A]